jgi:membrane protease YdiL (CAAX protease family)
MGFTIVEAIKYNLFPTLFVSEINMASDASKGPGPDVKLQTGAKTVSPSGDLFAADLRGFGPLGILAILVILFSGNVFVGNIVFPIGAILVLLWVRRSRTPWQEIGYVRPKSWMGSLATGLAFGLAFKFLMKAVVMPLLGASAINPSYHYLVGNEAMLPAAIWAMLVAGFGEETVFRGWLFERFDKLFGSGGWARTLIVILSSVLFGLGHYADQGLAGVEQATIVGLVFGSIFAVTGRIFMLMIAHAAFDLTALAIIYWNLESRVASLIFQ